MENDSITCLLTARCLDQSPEFFQALVDFSTTFDIVESVSEIVSSVVDVYTIFSIILTLKTQESFDILNEALKQETHWQSASLTIIEPRNQNIEYYLNMRVIIYPDEVGATLKALFQVCSECNLLIRNIDNRSGNTLYRNNQAHSITLSLCSKSDLTPFPKDLEERLTWLVRNYSIDILATTNTFWQRPNYKSLVCLSPEILVESYCLEENKIIYVTGASLLINTLSILGMKLALIGNCKKDTKLLEIINSDLNIDFAIAPQEFGVHSRRDAVRLMSQRFGTPMRNVLVINMIDARPVKAPLVLLHDPQKNLQQLFLLLGFQGQDTLRFLVASGNIPKCIYPKNNSMLTFLISGILIDHISCKIYEELMEQIPDDCDILSIRHRTIRHAVTLGITISYPAVLNINELSHNIEQNFIRAFKDRFNLTVRHHDSNWFEPIEIRPEITNDDGIISPMDGDSKQSLVLKGSPEVSLLRNKFMGGERCYSNKYRVKKRLSHPLNIIDRRFVVTFTSPTSFTFKQISCLINEIRSLDIKMHIIKSLSVSKQAVLALRIDCILPSEDKIDEIRKHILQLPKHENIVENTGVSVSFAEDEAFTWSSKLVVFDMDSTLIQNEMVDCIADYIGCKDAVSEITERTMRGELEFKEALYQRVAYFAGTNENDMLSVVAPQMTLTCGAKELCACLHKLGYKLAVVSGGFTQFADKLKLELNLDYCIANELETRDGVLTGKLIEDIVTAERKRDVLELLISVEQLIGPEQAIAIGDGANDIPMIQRAGLGISFCGKAKLQTVANMSIATPDLKQVLYHIGVCDDHQDELLS